MAAHARPRWWHRLTRPRRDHAPVAAPAPLPLPVEPVRMKGRHHRDPAPTAPLTLPDLSPPRRDHPYRPGESHLVRLAYDATRIWEGK